MFAGFGEKPRLRDLIDQAVAAWGCSEWDAYRWTEAVQKQNPALNLRQAKQLMQHTINQRLAASTR